MTRGHFGLDGGGEFRMIRIAEVFPDQDIVSTLSRQLGRSRFLEILTLKDPLQTNLAAPWQKNLMRPWNDHRKIHRTKFNR